MAKIVTFSRVFPAYHAKKGQYTYFVEAILSNLGIDYNDVSYFIWLVENNPNISERFLEGFFHSLKSDVELSKSHTIRDSKNPIKMGEFFNPMCWAGSHLTPRVNPYNKTPDGYWKIKFAPDIEVKKTFDIEITKSKTNKGIKGIDVLTRIEINKIHNTSNYYKLAKNDGLTFEELMDWFNKPFTGNIISWNENIEY